MKYDSSTTVKALRKAAKLSQEEFSKIIGISLRNYRDKENGKTPFNQYEIMKLISFFELDADDAYNIFYLNGEKTIFYKKNDNTNIFIKSKKKMHNK